MLSCKGHNCNFLTLCCYSSFFKLHNKLRFCKLSSFGFTFSYFVKSFLLPLRWAHPKRSDVVPSSVSISLRSHNNSLLGGGVVSGEDATSPLTPNNKPVSVLLGLWRLGGGWSGGSIGGSAVRRRVIGGIKDDAAH